VKQSFEEAAVWYRKAADQGMAQSQLKLGLLYSAGKGVSQDYNEAAKLFLKAADQGMPEGLFFAGVAFFS
jgi:TPR repeat protein